MWSEQTTTPKKTPPPPVAQVAIRALRRRTPIRVYFCFPLWQWPKSLSFLSSPLPWIFLLLSVIIITVFFFFHIVSYTPSLIIYVYVYMKPATLPPPTTLRKINILCIITRVCRKQISLDDYPGERIILYYIMCTHTRSTLMHYHKLSSYYYYYYNHHIKLCSLCSRVWSV